MMRLVFWGVLLSVVPLSVDARSEGWVITARDTTADYFAVAMANGEIGVAVGREPFALGSVILGGSYEPGFGDDVSRILEGINPLGLTMAVDGHRFDPSEVRPQHQSVDMRRAVHTNRFSTDGVTVVYRIRALRNMPYALMTEVEVTAERDAEVLFSNGHTVPGEFADTLRESRTVGCEDGSRIAVQRTSGSYNRGRDHIVASSTFLCGEGCEAGSPESVRIVLRKGGRASFSLVGTICTTAAFADPWNESERQAIYAAREGAAQLVAAHERKWAELWQGDIEIEGDPTAQLDVRFALFNLYGSIREGSRRSIPPMGLSARGFYNGHIFWDSEIWMYPALLVLRPCLARQMLDYRTDGLDAARRREGFPLMREAARFWCDRVTANADGSYSIRNVIGANEYAVGVTDNAFTNGAARRALEYASAAAELCGERPDPQWSAVAAGLRIPHFADGTTREHAGYDGEMIKQADANLLGYPLGIVTGREAQLRDLEYYERRIDPRNGPAMSYSVFAIQYARLGMAEKACEMFRRSYLPNLRPPFGVFAETATSGNPYFMTGAGGMLQAVLFGFGGLEITADGLVQRPSVLPPQWKNLRIKINGKIYQATNQ